MGASEEIDLVVSGARLVTCAGRGPTAHERLDVRADAAFAVRRGRVVWVGASADAPASRDVVDADGRVVLPGLVDPHTHLVFAGSRVDEFARKMAGEDYRTIAAAGGGIASTVRATRAATDAELLERATQRMLAMRAHGVTTVEVKSGYELTRAGELRMLRIAREAGRATGLRVTTTLLAAHALPPERAQDRAGWIEEITREILPEALALGLVDSIDAYVDENAFSVDEVRPMYEAARNAGLAVCGHVGQFRDMGGAELLAEMQARSADHLEAVSDSGLAALARAGTVGVLLPGAWRTLRQTPPDAQRLIAAGLTIAIGTDCNPGTSPTTDLLACAALAVRDAGLTCEEALLAVTRASARAANVADAGWLGVGAAASFALFDADDPRALVYAMSDTRASQVYVDGHSRETAYQTRIPWT